VRRPQTYVGGMERFSAKRPRALKDGNGKFKALLAEQMLDSNRSIANACQILT